MLHEISTIQGEKGKKEKSGMHLDLNLGPLDYKTSMLPFIRLDFTLMKDKIQKLELHIIFCVDFQCKTTKNDTWNFYKVNFWGLLIFHVTVLNLILKNVTWNFNEVKFCEFFGSVDFYCNNTNHLQQSRFLHISKKAFSDNSDIVDF